MPEWIKLLDVGCSPEAAVPAPVLVQSEASTTLIFNAIKKQGETYPPVGRAVVSFAHCTITKFGYPNDEAWSAIPRTKGLSYDLYEVLGSDWAEELDHLNHFAFPEYKRRSQRHFIILFHDSLFECLANDVSVKLSTESFSTLLASLGDHLGQE